MKSTNNHYVPVFCTLLLTLLFSTGFLSSAQAQGTDVKVAVAASLLPPMQKIKQLFEEKYTATSLTILSGSSGKLTAQILNGAPYDVFISADRQYPEQVYREGHAQQKPEVLTRGKLVFWSKKKTEQSRIPALLQNKSIKTIALAQPELAPYGQRAKDWLEEHQLYQKLAGKLVFGENVGQVNQYILSGTVEAAFTAISAQYAPELQDKGYWYPLEVRQGDPESLGHSLVLLTNAESSPRAIDQFLEFIKSPIAGEVFLEFGYELP